MSCIVQNEVHGGCTIDLNTITCNIKFDQTTCSFYVLKSIKNTERFETVNVITFSQGFETEA